MFRVILILMVATTRVRPELPARRRRNSLPFPTKGQNQEQQNKDKFECHSFASQQSGFDPSAPPPQSPSTTTTARQPRSDAEVKSAGQGSAVKGAAVGGGRRGHLSEGFPVVPAEREKVAAHRCGSGPFAGRGQKAQKARRGPQSPASGTGSRQARAATEPAKAAGTSTTPATKSSKL